MKPSQIAKTAAQATFEPIEALRSQVAKPIFDETMDELGGFFGMPSRIGSKPQSIAQEDLSRSRQEQKLKEMEEKDQQASKESAQKIFIAIQSEYKITQTSQDREQKKLKDEFVELQSEVVRLAKAAGVGTKAHLETATKKIGVIDIKFLTTIVRFLRSRAEESKSGQDLISQRTNAKRPTGMMAWVSGKQMKIHEQGTLQLQG